METSAQAALATLHTPCFVALPKLADGERYAGIVIDADGHPTHHLILLPGESRKTWDDGIEWAKSQGGDLPTRQELALLFANLKDDFEPDWHWSSELSAIEIFAWVQTFNDGRQYIGDKDYRRRVRAVRRLPIN